MVHWVLQNSPYLEEPKSAYSSPFKAQVCLQSYLEGIFEVAQKLAPGTSAFNSEPRASTSTSQCLQAEGLPCTGFGCSCRGKVAAHGVQPWLASADASTGLQGAKKEQRSRMSHVFVLRVFLYGHLLYVGPHLILVGSVLWPLFVYGI